MKIKRIKSDKNQFLHLLLLGDEQESMIDRYLEQENFFADNYGHLIFENGVQFPIFLN
jgi:hypothetical protein